jgi:hypothetical protein
MGLAVERIEPNWTPAGVLVNLFALGRTNPKLLIRREPNIPNYFANRRIVDTDSLIVMVDYAFWLCCVLCFFVHRIVSKKV